MEKIAIIGTGLIGRAWAMVFARAGHSVRIWDNQPDAAAKALALINAPKGDYAWHADAGSFAFTLANQSDEHADAFGQPRGQSGINANGSNAWHEHGFLARNER